MATAVRERDVALAKAIRFLGEEDFSRSLSTFVGKLTAFDNLIVIIYNGKGTPAVLYRQCKDPVVYLNMDRSYLTGAYQLDPFYHEHLKGADNGVRRLVEVAPSKLTRSDYFSAYYRQTTLVDEVAIFANLGGNKTVTACFGKDRSSGVAFAPDELKLLRSYEHVLSSLLEAQWKDYAFDRPGGEARPASSESFRRAIAARTGIGLSPRQAEVAAYILQGHSTLSIGLHLGISPETVKVFRRQLYARCNISSQAELFALLMPLFSQLAAKQAARRKPAGKPLAAS